MKQHVFHAALVSALLFAASSAAQGDPPRTQDMMRDAIGLSSTLGRVHAIRTTCRGNNDQYWREQMKELLSLEAPNSSALRRSMTNAFNDAYQRERRLRSVCDEGAREAEAAYAAEGRRLSDALAAAYLPKQ